MGTLAQPPSRPPPDPLIGRTLGGNYRITSLLGRGGMSRVYRAMQAPLDRAVALKVLKDDPNDPTLQRRFLFEASVTSKLTHPNTITIFDYGADQGLLFFAMELLRGMTLLDALKAQGRIAETRTIHIARQICRSLREAHAHGLVHRDLKPSNFFLLDHADEQDFVKVLDFGLVKLFGNEDPQITSGGLVLGTPHYMPPEQARGLQCDQRSDVYSLGVVLFQMLTGRVPFEGRASMDVLLQHVTEPPPRLGDSCPGLQVSAEMQAVVAKCMAKKPEDRFQNMEELLCALPGDRPAGPRPPPPPLDDDSIPLIDATPQPLRATTGKMVGAAGDTKQIPGAPRATMEGVVQGAALEAARPAPRRAMWIGGLIVLALAAGAGVVLRAGHGRASAAPALAAAPSEPLVPAPVVAAASAGPATTGAAPKGPQGAAPAAPAGSAPPAAAPAAAGASAAAPAGASAAAPAVSAAAPVAAPIVEAPAAKAAPAAAREEAPVETRKQSSKRAERRVAAAPKHASSAAAAASPEVLEALNDRLARAVPGVRQCTMLHRAQARGEVQVTVSVEPSGAVSGLRLGGDLGAKLEDCIRGAVQRIRFEPYDGPAVTLQRKISLTSQ